MKFVHFFLFALYFLTMVSSTDAYADDELLLMIPPIVAASNSLEEPPTEPEGLTRVKQLAGTWLFSDPSDSFFDTYFRFNSATAEQSDDEAIFTILGDSSLFSDFFSEWCDGGIVGSYSSDANGYIILCNWGFPDFDLGSVYFFPTVTNSFSFEEFYYIPSTSMLSTGTLVRVGVASLISDVQSKLNEAVARQSGSAEVIAKREADLVEKNRLQLAEINSLGAAALNQRALVTGKIQSHLSELIDLTK